MREYGEIFVDCKGKELLVSDEKIKKTQVSPFDAFIKGAVDMKYMGNRNDIFDVTRNIFRDSIHRYFYVLDFLLVQVIRYSDVKNCIYRYNGDKNAKDIQYQYL